MAREVELKFQLPDERAADALAEAAGGDRLGTVVQLNHVFDTPSRALRAHGLTLRLRDQEGDWKVTLKGPAARLGAAMDREELEAPTDARRAEAMLAGGESPLEALGAGGRSIALLEEARALAGSGVRPLGSFRNRRTRVRTSVPGYGAAVLEIDRTELPGGRVDHEVELEIDLPPGREARRVAARAETWLRRLLRDVGVEPLPGSGKTGRFLAAAYRR